MAVTTFATERSLQVTAAEARGSHTMRGPDDTGITGYRYFSFTQGAAAGDITSTFGLFYMDPGRYRILSMLVDNSAWGTSATLSIGYGAYVDPTGTTIALSAAAFLSAFDVAAAHVATPFNVNTGQAVFDIGGSTNGGLGMLIYGTVAGAVIPAGATLKGHFRFGQA